MMRNDPLKTTVSVHSFLSTGAEPLKLELLAGESGLKHTIAEAAINRPGLALTGFFPHFAHRRIQVIGLAEHAYLSSLDDKERRRRLEGFFKKRIPCVVLSRQKKVFPEMQVLAEEQRVPLLRSSMITKHFVNSATILMENLMAPRSTVQGTMVDIMGIGILIEGKPGMGKSEAALSLVRNGHALVADDVTALRRDSAGALVGSAVDVTRYHMEIRGIGIIHVPSLFGVSSVRREKLLDLVISLCQPGTMDEDDRSGNTQHFRTLLGVDVPQCFVPVAPGRDLANVIETAALRLKLKRLGHDAEKELDERLMELMSRGRNASE